MWPHVVWVCLLTHTVEAAECLTLLSVSSFFDAFSCNFFPINNIECIKHLWTNPRKQPPQLIVYGTTATFFFFYQEVSMLRMRQAQTVRKSDGAKTF